MSSSSGIRRYHVFPSFHGPDVRKGFLSHLHNYFESKGIRTFKDQKIERGQTIGPELVQAIRESRVSLVVLSKEYASSSWCLDELVEILKCKEASGQIVMTIFYEVDPSDVRKQSGVFGSAFEKTCQGKTEEVKLRWSKALACVATTAGEHSLNWANEADMIQKITTDVSKKLNATPSRDFEGMVGMEAHLTKLHSLLCLESDEVKMVGIWGPAGIGKTTIARALYSQISSSFPFICFMGDLKGISKSVEGVDDYKRKLILQTQLLSKILNQENMEINNLDGIKEWLQDQRVLIILDDVDDLEQLEALAKEFSWFGSGSRIIITTEDMKILKAHGIHDIYHVDFPSEAEALEILCLSAFKQSCVRDGFEELAKKVAELCGNLPLGLCVVGSSLRGESKHEWELQLSRIEASLDRKIESILKVGYDRLSTKDKSLFLHVACIFNNDDVDYVISMLSDSNLDVRYGLKILADKSLVHISINRRIVMHHLLQKLGRQVVLQQSDEPGKRQFLVEAEEIHDVLTNETGTGSVIGISYYKSKMGKVSLSKRAFEGMRNLQFLRFKIWYGTLQIPKDMKYLPRLRVLYWIGYPRKSLPPKFQPERLVEICMAHSNLEKLWGGIQPLPNLKSINLNWSYRLREIPNLSNATNLEKLELSGCTSLVELPSSISNLHKLITLNMFGCKNLKVIPTNINLASLEQVDMDSCSRLTSFPDLSSNIKGLRLGGTKIEDFPPSIVGCWSRLEFLQITIRSLKRLTHVPLSVKELHLGYSDIKRIPDCVTSLPHLVDLSVENCTKLVSIPVLPPSLESVNARECVSLERVCCSFQNPIVKLTFYNCLELDEKTRRGILQQSIREYICLPGKEIPAEFTHKATGKSVTIPLAPATFSDSSRFKACLLISPIQDGIHHYIRWRLKTKRGVTIHSWGWYAHIGDPSPRSEHLIIFHGPLFHDEVHETISYEVVVTMGEIIFEFSCEGADDKIIECGVQIMTEEAEGSSRSEVDNFETESSRSELDSFETKSTSSVLEIKSCNKRKRETSKKRMKKREAATAKRKKKNTSQIGEAEPTKQSQREAYYETEGNNNHHPHGDGDDDYEAEGFKSSQIKSTKARKQISFRSWFTKHGLRKKKINKTRANSVQR